MILLSHSQWIGSQVSATDGLDQTGRSDWSRGAPWLRTTVDCPAAPLEATLRIACAGWCELFLNGSRVGEQVLSSVATQFDRRVSYLSFDVTAQLHTGRNALAVLLGNGWFNCQTLEIWGYTTAP